MKPYRFPKPIMVTRPTLPPLDSFTEHLSDIWESGWLTNDGKYHKKFEKGLSAYLDVDNVSLFCNGTIALLIALQALRINSGEVITTPFTFPATPHVLYWNGVKPVFCDIDPRTFNLDPGRIEALISPNTKAILPVHVFGTPCDVEGIQSIADRHGLHVIYDAAHAFGVRYRGRSLTEYGDISMLSFHATKLFTSIEGGALVMKSAAHKNRISFLKNFGIADEETVIGPGINGKMNELQAAFGLLQLDMVEQEIADREVLTGLYRQGLRDIPGLTLMDEIPHTKSNFSYFPVLVDPARAGMTRDGLYLEMQKYNIYTRKYFHPLCSHYSCYSSLPSAAADNLPVAEQVAGQTLCLPLYGTLPEESVTNICAALRELLPARKQVDFAMPPGVRAESDTGKTENRLGAEKKK